MPFVKRVTAQEYHAVRKAHADASGCRIASHPVVLQFHAAEFTVVGTGRNNLLVIRYNYLTLLRDD